MRFTTTILLIILFCWGGISCTKGGGNIYVEGYVINLVTGEGIPNATVILRKSSSGGAPGAQSSGFKTVETVTTDENGYYELSHATILVNSYYVRVEEPSDQDYYHIGFAENESGVEVGNSQFKVDKGKNIIVDYEMVPKGEYNFHIKNINCQGPNDNIKIIYLGAEVENEPSRVGDVFVDIDGCVDVNDGDFWIKQPIGERYFKWEVTKNGITQEYYDTIIILPNNKLVYEVFY